MHKPLIGITAGEINNRDRPSAPMAHGQGHTYIESIIRCGGLPVILPITDDKEVLNEILDKIDGLLLAGGNDINPKMYGEEPHETVKDFSDKRDLTEKILLEHALSAGLPILAICRGMQFVNIHFGGNLYQDIATFLPEANLHDQGAHSDGTVDDHPIHIKENSKLSRILDMPEITVNTFHHQAVKNVGQNLRISAYSDDGIIEGLETNDDRFIIGVQAHPESLGSKVPQWDRLFEAFIQEAGRTSKTKTPASLQSSVGI